MTGTAQDVTDRVAARQELEVSHENLRRFAANLITAREEERARISREIHDQCGQMLTGLKMDVVWFARHLSDQETTLQERIAAMSKLVDETVQTVRHIATELRPGVLDDLGLAAAVEWQAEQFTKRTGIPCEVRAHVRESELKPQVAITVFRIFQESLTNVVRHSGATAVGTTLQEIDGHLVFDVCDNGRGISEQDVRPLQSTGLVGMRERALLVGGVLSVVGSPREGTTVRFRVPLRRTEGGE